MYAINVYSPKGGVGTTTVASLLALDMSNHHYVGLVSKDTESLFATLAHPVTRTPSKISHALTISDEPIQDCDFLFFDSRAHMPAADLNILVCNSTYLALRRCLSQKFDLAVVQMLPSASLQPADIFTVLGGDEHVLINWDPATLRKLDSGLVRGILKENDQFKQLIAAVDNHIKTEASF